jgi:hypothetical protein
MAPQAPIVIQLTYGFRKKENLPNLWRSVRQQILLQKVFWHFQDNPRLARL